MLNKNKKVETELMEDELVIEKALKEAIKNAEEENSEEAEKDREYRITPAEELTDSIADYLAHMTADRFGKVVRETGPAAVRQLILRIEHSESETVIKMLQAVFLSCGMTHAAEDLDILMLCEKHDSEVYNAFFDSLMETEVIGGYMTGCLLSGCCGSDTDTDEDEEDEEVDIWQIL